MEEDADVANTLSRSLSRMSVGATRNQEANLVPSDLSINPPTPQSLRKSVSNQSLNGRSPGLQRRSSGLPNVRSQPQSPTATRKSYGALEKRDQQATPTKPSSRRTSSSNQSPKVPPTFSTSASIPENDTVEITAAAVAAECFVKELSVHVNGPQISPETIVIVHDACYGHRFSRPKTSKATLSMIVERPERLQAAVSGIATAYVRLGQRHMGGASAPHLDEPIPDSVPFWIRRSVNSIPLSSPIVTAIHGTKWMQELGTMCNTAGQKLAAGAKELTRPETPSGGIAKPKLHEGDLYLCKESLYAFEGALGGVIDGVDAVFGPSDKSGNDLVGKRPKRAFVCVRPPGHHCSADMPSGFCWLNNVHVGIEHAAQSHGLTHAAIIDFDLHHGDGSQTITWERNNKAAKTPKNAPLSKKTSIGYFSLHDINSYPCEYGDQEKVQNASLCLENAHNQTIWNVHLQPWKVEAEFWNLYETRYLALVEKAKTYLKTQTQRLRALSPSVVPKSAIFISAGFDASEWEGEGMQRHKVNVPTEFYARFTSDIISVAEEPDTAAEGRVISVLEGGYSDRALMSGVLSHVCGLTNVGEKSSIASNGNVSGASTEHAVERAAGYDKTWWSKENLMEFEALFHPSAPHSSRKIRTQELSTFATPTQSFTAKVVDPSKVYRSLSGAAPVPEPVRPPTPPPPDVDWGTAAHELRRLLVPTDRSVSSHRHDELAEPRVKRERHSSIGLPSEAPGDKMQLRGRRAKAQDVTKGEMNGTSVPIREASSSSRRRTIDALPLPLSRDGVQETDRPSTSDSKPPLDGLSTTEGTATSSERTSRTTSPTKRTSADGKVHRTRRVSGAIGDLKLENSVSKPPPVPQLPVTFHTGRANTSAPNSDQPKPNGDIDSITTGIKRIILKPSKDSSSATAPKPARKPAVPRAPKATAPKTTAARVSKSAKGPASIITSIPSQSTANPTSEVSAKSASSTVVASSGNIKSEVPNTQLATDTFKQPLSGVASSIEEMQQASSSLEPRRPDLSTVKDAGSSVPMVSEPPPRSPLQAAQLDGMLIDEKESLITPPTASIPKDLTKPSEPSGFIAYDPSTDYATDPSNPSSGAIVQPETYKWLPPNTNTPVKKPSNTTKGSKQDLPIFSSSGTIPFGQNTKEALGLAETNVGTKAAENQKSDQNIWDVPKTPQR